MSDYRIQISATKGEQILVERQYNSDGRGHWTTISKFMTVDLSVAPERYLKVWYVLLSSKLTYLDCCVVCGLPRVDSPEGGCTENVCTFYPPPGYPTYYTNGLRRMELGYDLLPGWYQEEAAKVEEIMRSAESLDPETILPKEY